MSHITDLPYTVNLLPNRREILFDEIKLTDAVSRLFAQRHTYPEIPPLIKEGIELIHDRRCALQHLPT